MSDSILIRLVLLFASLSLVSVGGAPSILPELQRQVVDVFGWMDNRKFVETFALAQTAPGPNMMVVSLIGWRVAGLAGAMVATLAVAVPSSVLVLLVSGAWYRFRDAPWRKAVQAGLMPVTAGLIMASAALFIQEASVGWATIAVIAAALPLFMFTKLHPLLILGAAAALGAVGGSGG